MNSRLNQIELDHTEFTDKTAEINKKMKKDIKKIENDIENIKVDMINITLEQRKRNTNIYSMVEQVTIILRLSRRILKNTKNSKLLFLTMFKK